MKQHPQKVAVEALTLARGQVLLNDTKGCRGLARTACWLKELCGSSLLTTINWPDDSQAARWPFR